MLKYLACIIIIVMFASETKTITIINNESNLQQIEDHA